MPKSSRSVQGLVAFGLLLIGGVVLRCLGIGILGIGDHEQPSLLFCMSSTLGEANGLLYHNFYLPLWIRTLGDSVLSLRLASVVCGLGGLVGMFLLGRRIGGIRLGLGAVFFLAINNFDILLSQHIRFHELNSCLCIWATWAFVGWLERQDWRSWLVYVFFGALSLGTMVLSYVLLCLQLFGALLFVPSSRRSWLWSLGGFTLFTAIFALLWGMDATAYQRIDDLYVPGLGHLLSSYHEIFAFVDRYDESLPVAEWLDDTPIKLLWISSALLLAWHLVCWGRGRSCAQRHCGWIWITLAAVPLLWGASHVIKSIFKPTNLSFILPFTALIFAVCLGELPRRLRYVVLVLLFVLNRVNVCTPESMDRYSADACARYIVDCLNGSSKYPQSPRADVPSYVFGFPWRHSCEPLLHTRAHLFLDAMQVQSANESVSREAAFIDMVNDAKRGAFPLPCDLWYYTPFFISEHDVEVLYRSLHPRYVSTFNYMGRCLLRIRLDKQHNNATYPTPLRQPYIKGST